MSIQKKQVRAHRQAWAWQDEWFGLSMENIREFERETQLLLQRKMGLDGEDEDEDGKFNNVKSHHSENDTNIYIERITFRLYSGCSRFECQQTFITISVD